MNKLNIILGILINTIFLLLNVQSNPANTLINLSNTKQPLLLSFPMVLFILCGNLLISLCIYTLFHLYQYKVGKYFTMYLLTIGSSFYLIPMATNNLYLQYVVHILISLSCIFLFNTLGTITLFYKKKRFMALSLFQFIYFLFSTFQLILRKHNELNNHYMITLTILLTMCLYLLIQKSVTSLTKNQMRILFVGTTLGGILYFIINNLPIMSIINTNQLPDTYEPGTTIEMIGNYTVSDNNMPLFIFTITTLSLILLLMKRDFFNKRCLHSLSKLILINGYLLFMDYILLWTGLMNPIILLLFNLTFLLFILYVTNNLKTTKDDSNDANYHQRILEEIESEKEKLSIFLHDDILQDLISILHMFSSQQFIDHKDWVITELKDMINKIRYLSHELYPIMIKDIGLEHGLKLYLTELKEKHSIDMVYEYELPMGILPETTSLTIYRIIKELVTNSLKHGKCSYIGIILTMKNDTTIEITVSDNGVGFSMPTDDILLKNAHMGLYTIKKQIYKLKGEFYCSAKECSGTKYIMSFPLSL